MEKKQSKPGSKKTWECSHGCDISKEACSHLNALVDDPPSHSVKHIPVERIDSFYYESGAGVVLPPEIRDRVYEIQFRSKLKKAGLPQLKIEILVNRFCYDASLQDIAQEMNFVSTSSVLRLLNESLEYLKKRGFK